MLLISLCLLMIFFCNADLFPLRQNQLLLHLPMMTFIQLNGSENSLDHTGGRSTKYGKYNLTRVSFFFFL